MMQHSTSTTLIETRYKDSVQPSAIQPEKLRPKLPQIYLDKRPKIKHSDVVPKLVELQQYPGFKEKKPTKLPNDTVLEHVWAKVLQARRKMLKQTGYLAVLQELLVSTLLQDLLLDTFWWLFLHLYQASYAVQCQLFDRISKNYVLLIMRCQSYLYGDRFLQELPSTLSQAVYVSFCCSFPQSWIQFHNDNFRSEVCNIVYQWFGGMCPIPRVYNNWNYDVLLPQEVKDMKSRTTKDTEHDKKKGANLSLTDVHWLPSDSCDSETTESSLSSSSSELKISFHMSVDSESSSVKMNNISSVQLKSSMEPSNQHLAKSSSSLSKHQSGRKMSTSSFRLAQVAPRKQSHVAGRGAEFMKNLFNLSGLSPLVLNFLQRLKLEPQAGKNVYVTRTEIQRLPPDDAATYSDVIEAGFQNVLKLKEMRQKLLPQQKPKSFFPSRRARGPQNGLFLDREPTARKGGEKGWRDRAAVSPGQGSSEEWQQQEEAAAGTTDSHKLFVLEEEDTSHREDKGAADNIKDSSAHLESSMMDERQSLIPHGAPPDRVKMDYLKVAKKY
ncbi:protein FAM227A-like isoform X2 [Scyliorhinus canicula]|uniref:protein FAM227A-like isoform X2 n=1 Tax=Scyliorhinus canicula TaxID=7830 RepID=UPI0018F446C5|nr:protein FAM227A-like isoform X2 [Scyliorhinus canicula]